MATPAPYDPQLDALIFELAASLERPQRAAFEDAARAVVAALPYLGPGVVYLAQAVAAPIFPAAGRHANRPDARLGNPQTIKAHRRRAPW